MWCCAQTYEASAIHASSLTVTCQYTYRCTDIHVYMCCACWCTWRLHVLHMAGAYISNLVHIYTHARMHLWYINHARMVLWFVVLICCVAMLLVFHIQNVDLVFWAEVNYAMLLCYAILCYASTANDMLSHAMPKLVVWYAMLNYDKVC